MLVKLSEVHPVRFKQILREGILLALSDKLVLVIFSLEADVAMEVLADLSCLLSRILPLICLWNNGKQKEENGVASPSEKPRSPGQELFSSSTGPRSFSEIQHVNAFVSVDVVLDLAFG